MGPKRFKSQNFSLFIGKFKKLGFSAPLRAKTKDKRLLKFFCIIRVQLKFTLEYCSEKFSFIGFLEVVKV